jgi:hypothetical protein
VTALGMAMRSALAAAADPQRAPRMQACTVLRMDRSWEVARHMAANEARLSGLSRREALKNIASRRGR